MRIAYDATTLRPSQTGIGYYTEHLLRHLIEVAPECEFHLISNRRVQTSQPLNGGVSIPDRLRFPVRNVWMQVMAPKILRDLRPDVAHFTNSISPLIGSVPTVLTVHDMSLVSLPGFHPFRRRLFRPLQAAALRRADAVITVSEASKNDILRLSGIPERRLHVIHEAASPAFRPIDDRRLLQTVKKRYDLPERFILFVGTLEPRKNLKRLIEAFSILKKGKGIAHRLVLVGMLGWGYREVKAAIGASGLRSDIQVTGYVPFSDLPALYNLAEIFVFPSIHEGFGLPLLEAMSCGVPAVASNHESLLEVAGEAVLRADPGDVDALAEAIGRLVESEPERRRLSALGLRHAARYSWESTARLTLEVYSKIATAPDSVPT